MSISQLRNQRLLVIAPTAPMNACGVSDYAYLTAVELTKFYNLVEIGVAQLPTEIKLSTDKLLTITSWQQVLAQASKPDEASDVLLNYTPASYARSGWPIELIVALRRFKAANSANRLFIFIHETWNGSSALKLHHRIRDKLTKRSLGQIGKLANAIAVVTNEQKQKLESSLNISNIHLSLVGANILPVDEGVGLISKRQLGVWIVFGLAHTRLWAIQSHLPFIKSLHKQGVLLQLRTIGPKDNSYARQEALLIDEHLGAKFLKQCGVLEPIDVSTELLCADAALVGQDADSLKKSGTFAALAAHAVTVVCAVPVTLNDPPGKALFHPDEVMLNPDCIHSDDGEHRRRQLHNWFWTTRSWQAISQDLRDWIQAAK